MDVKFTPWRLPYITGPKPDGCVFCLAAAANDDSEFGVVARGEHGFVLLNAYPYNNGHLMVVPYGHVSDLLALADAAADELLALTRRSVAALQRAMHPTGFNLGMNLGEVAGAGIADHLHMHVVPRWAGDTNFMSVLGDTRLIPQALDETWKVVRAAWQDEAAVSPGSSDGPGRPQPTQAPARDR